MLKLVLLKIVLLRFQKAARRMAGVDTLSTLDIRSLSNIGAQLFEYAHLECSVRFARLMCTSRLGVVYSYCSPLLTVLQRPSLQSLGVDIEISEGNRTIFCPPERVSWISLALRCIDGQEVDQHPDDSRCQPGGGRTRRTKINEISIFFPSMIPFRTKISLKLQPGVQSGPDER